MRTLLQTLQNVAAAALTLLLINQTGLAQDAASNHLAMQSAQPTPMAAAPAFRASVFPSLDPLILKLVFENPAKSMLTLRLRNEYGEVVYQKPLGKVASYNGRVYLSEVTDGNYTLEIAGRSVRYAWPFRVGTRVTRLTQVR
jgi:hypothetical protein